MDKTTQILDLQNQSSLAKLLAKENITVTHSSRLETAYFDVKNRVLGLPVWKNKGKVVYDMLVGHEVSHALHTPEEGFEKFIEANGRKNFDILNIIEDIRIERLIMKKYAGMPRIFKGAYKSLHESDFFKIADKNLNELLFVDRLNLKGKLRDLVDVSFNEEETELYNECLKAESFEEVVDLYHKVLEYSKREKELKAKNKAQAKSEETNEGEEEGEGASGGDSGDEGEFETQQSYIPEAGDVADDGTESYSITSENDNGSNDDTITDEDYQEAFEKLAEELTTGEKGTDASDSKGEDVETIIEEDEDEIVSETMAAMQDSLVEDIDDDRYAPNIALWPKKSTIEKHIIGYKEVMAARPADALNFQKAQDSYESIHYGEDRNIEEDFTAFKKNINKKTGVLVREFERRKAAYQYSRARESRRGSLDVNKLHKYKYDDQIFQSVMHLADAKSHGMIFFIDYSGSMSSVLHQVLEHTLNLVHFCKKVGVPFEVYSFTSNYCFQNDGEEKDRDQSQSEMEFDFEDVVISQLFSNEMSKSEYDKAFKQISYQVMMSQSSGYYRNFSSYGVSKYEHLGGTPLDHTLVAANHIVKEFEKRNGNQKTNVMVLTDGESHCCRPTHRSWGSKYHTTLNGKVYTIGEGYGPNTYDFTRILKQNTGATLVGWFLPNSKTDGNRHLNRMAQNYNSVRSDAYATAGKWMKTYRKEGFYMQKNCFEYDAYFLLSSDVEIKDEDFDFSGAEGKTLTDNRGEQAKLARQFAKHNSSSRKNRIIMTQFAEIIA